MTQLARAMMGGAAAVALLASAAGAAGPPSGPLKRCPIDAVVSGTTCMDKYEASVWRVPDPTGSNKSVVAKIQQGKATAALLAAAGATQVGAGIDDYAPCADNGQSGCTDVYAASLPGVIPATAISWFQAQQACKNSRKRLPTNAEWQGAVAGTPDPGADDGSTTCNTTGVAPIVATGSRIGCISSDGAFDMVGNLFEWVADWVPRSTDPCGSWGPGVSPTNDYQCLTGAANSGQPGALARGGSFVSTTAAGPFAITGQAPLVTAIALGDYGFRCIR